MNPSCWRILSAKCLSFSERSLSNINPNYEKSSVKFVEEPVLNISEYNIVAIMTEWDEFKAFDWETIYKKIKKPAYIFDGRNILNSINIKNIGFNYIGLGRE